MSRALPSSLRTNLQFVVSKFSKRLDPEISTNGKGLTASKGVLNVTKSRWRSSATAAIALPLDDCASTRRLLKRAGCEESTSCVLFEVFLFFPNGFHRNSHMFVCSKTHARTWARVFLLISAYYAPFLDALITTAEARVRAVAHGSELRNAGHSPAPPTRLRQP